MPNTFYKTYWTGYLGEIRPILDIEVVPFNPNCSFTGTAEYDTGATPTPSATPSPTPSPTSTPSPTPSATASPTPSATPSPTPSPTADITSFKMTIQTDLTGGTSNSDQFTLPTSGSSNNFDVDWGDGVIELWSGTTGNITHTYPYPGTFQLKISRTLRSIRFNATGDRTKVLSIDQWGNIPWGTFDAAFDGCSNMDMVATDAPVLTGVTSLNVTFRNCVKMTGNTSFNSWNTSTITNMNGTFFNCDAFNQPLSGWNTSNVTIMSGLFANCNIFNQNINNWDTRKVTTFAITFSNADSFNQPLSGWVTSAATMMNGMFNSNAVFNQPINNWDVRNVTDFSDMFRGPGVFNQPLSSWVTSAATRMDGMFAGVPFNQDISNWDVRKVTNFQRMFQGNGSYNQSVSGWTTTAATNMFEVFSNSTNFNQDLSYLDLDSIPNGYNFSLFLSGTSVSTENYSRMLIGWANQVNTLNKPTGCTINNGNRTYDCTNYGGSPYSDGVAARAYLVSRGWTITDGGQTGSPCPTATPTPSPTNTPSATPSPTPSPTP